MSDIQPTRVRGISSIELMDAICKALDMDATFITQMDIVLRPGEPCIIEFERVGDSRLLEFNWDKLGNQDE